MKDSIAEQILNILKIIRDEQKSITRYLEKIDSEREILEDIRQGQAVLKEQNANHRNHLDNIVEDVKTEVKIQGIKTEDKLEEAKEKMEVTSDKVEQIKDVLTK